MTGQLEGRGMNYEKASKYAEILNKYIMMCVENFVGRHGTITDEHKPKIKAEAKRHVERLKVTHPDYHDEIDEAWNVTWEAFLMALDEMNEKGGEG
jgi:hypothetical protein